MDREFGMDMCMLLYLRTCTLQGTLLTVMWQPGWEGSLGETGCMYVYDSVCYSLKLSHCLLIGYTLMKNKKF